MLPDNDYSYQTATLPKGTKVQDSVGNKTRFNSNIQVTILDSSDPANTQILVEKQVYYVNYNDLRDVR